MNIRQLNILVTGGTTREAFDDVRHISNKSRNLDHGHRVASELAKLGAKVTLVSTKTHLPNPNQVTVIDTKQDGSKIISTNDLREKIDEIVKWFNIVVHLSVTPSITPREKKTGKVKRELGSERTTFRVEKNIDLLQHIKNKNFPVAGYDTRQNLIINKGMEDFKTLITNCLSPERVTSSEKIIPLTNYTQQLDGKKIIVTSGRTEEQVTSTGDVITNFASGRQGHAIAQALADMGANVVLVTGPTLLPDPVDRRITTIHIKSANELKNTTLQQLPADAAVCVCAVTNFGLGESSFYDSETSDNENLCLDLMPDTLASLGKHESNRPRVVVGFAAETDNLIKYANGKLNNKGVDMIVANNVARARARDNKRNEVHFVSKEGVESLDEMSKYEVGLKIGQKIVKLLQ
jgi:phosphopantothenoylcysteine synthetase/decarboxylase